MKTKELISRLQRLDPSGENECCIDFNQAIIAVEIAEYYYNGKLPLFECDENNAPVTARRLNKGDKIVLTGVTMQDVLTEYSNDLKIIYATEDEKQRYEAIDEEYRRQMPAVELLVDRDQFVNWVFIKIQSVRKVPIGWIDRIKTTAEKFYDDNHMGPDSAFVKMKANRSYADCYEEYLEDTFFVNWDEYSRIIIKHR